MKNYLTYLEVYVNKILPEVNPENITKGYSFCNFSDDEVFLEMVSIYVTKNKDICILNSTSLNPNSFGYGTGQVYFSRNGDLEDKNIINELVDFVEDFINYFIYNNFENKEWRKTLKTEWYRFVKDYESEVCEVEFLAPIYEFWLNYSGKLEDTFNSNGVVLGWLNSRSNYNLLKNNDKPDRKNEVIPTYLLVRKVNLNKKEGFTSLFNETSNLFKLNTLMLRTLFGGTAHIRFMAIKCIGNLSGYIPSFLNQYYPSFEKEYGRYPTQINSQYEQEKSFKYWKVLSTKDYGNWAFADFKLQENASRPVLDDMDKAHADYMYMLSEQMDKTVNLIQTLESLVGELGKYLGEWVLDIAYTPEQQNQEYVISIKGTIDNFVRLRNKYLHGSILDKPDTTDSLVKLINQKYSKIEDMSKDHEIVERVVRKVLEVSFLNLNLKRYCLEYYKYKYPKEKKLMHDMVLEFPEGRQLPSLVRI